MFSKALFKQSCKANGTMWIIITFAVCFMLACVMLISGNDSIGATVNAVEDTIINKEIEASMKNRAINYYDSQTDGMMKFDEYFVSDMKDVSEYAAMLALWSQNPSGEMPEPQSATAKIYADNISAWKEKMPNRANFDSPEKYAEALSQWQAASPMTQTGAGAAAYTRACEQLQEYVKEKAAALNPDFTEDSAETQEMLGCVMYAINPNGMFDKFYTDNGETAPAMYDVSPIAAHISDADTYIKSDERLYYIEDRSAFCASVFLSGNITLPENEQKIIDELTGFGVTREKYDGFGYDYANVKNIALNSVVTYNSRLELETDRIAAEYEKGGMTDSEYAAALIKAKADLSGDVAASLLASLPKEVSSALEEVGKLDLYSLVVGSIFYKLAGLLLPIIYMIMASNNLIAGQVDSGSMAYVLSTSTKRQTVVFTQAVYLIGSLFAMFCLTTVTGCVCLSIVGDKVSLGYAELILLNLGAFLVLFALSGLCFLTSCWFDRSKRSMAVGGGLSIFALVAAMLGLFGSPVIPKVVRLDALNNFNYFTVITLFDAISIIDGTLVFLWKFAVLLGLGVLGYILGAVKFTQKDLPL